MTLFLSRLRILRNPQVDAVAALLDPARLPGRRDDREQGRRSDAHHRLVWSAFADGPDRKRDFLWRFEGRGTFIALSERPPVSGPFFEKPDIKPFAPDLRTGDRLNFLLRANATRTEKAGGLSASGKERRRHIDLVMDKLHPLPPGKESGDRQKARMGLAQVAASSWLAAQGARHGFALETLDVQDYSTFALPGHVGRRESQPQYGVLDLAGRVAVTEPEIFLARLVQGFGRAKAFGCGLMLIRRA
jgi:CRISPR system Cascade subunit CasE